MNNDTTPFELIKCEIHQIIFDDVSKEYLVSVVANGQEVGVHLSGYDGAMLTFADSNCAEHSHIKTIHQTLLEFKLQCGFSLENVYIEAKHGDVVYCRLHWMHDKRDIFNIVSIGDAFILHRLSVCDLYITKNVLALLEPFESEGFMESQED